MHKFNFRSAQIEKSGDPKYAGEVQFSCFNPFFVVL